jgi:type IV pilus assembly protein PilW
MNTLHRAHAQRRQPRRLAGFTLVEILVGLAIAMIGTVIMMEVLVTSDQRTRTSTAGNDALSSGAVMMHLLRRDLVQAGYGISASSLVGCNLQVPTGPVVPLAPVVINPPTALVPAGDPNTDRVLVVYGNDSGQPEGQEIVATAGSAYTVRAAAAYAQDDYVVAAPTPCAGTVTLARVTGVVGFTVSVNSLNATATTLYNLGRNPRIVAYAIRNGSLTSCDFLLADCRTNNAANWTAVGANIVSLRAQYGHDTAAAGTRDAIDLWDQSTPVDACQWARAPAVRFVLVTRSNQYESRLNATTKQRECDPVTATPRLWSGSIGTSPAPIDLSAAADWQCYRYKTFESVAPSRNTVWMRVPPGC